MSSAWRERAIAKSLGGARTRAEDRLQRYIDAALAIVAERGSTEFTVQEVVARADLSVRGFYQYFEGKDDLLLALFAESAREGVADLRAAVDAETAPLDRLRAFTVRFFELSDPTADAQTPEGRYRRPVAEFSLEYAIAHPARVAEAFEPVFLMLKDLLDEAIEAGAIKVTDSERTAVLMQQTIMWSWLGLGLAHPSPIFITAEHTWEFLLHGLGA